MRSIDQSERTKLDQHKLLQLIVPCSFIISFAALEALLRVKDKSFYEAWFVQNPEGNFSVFVNMHIFIFFGHILYPVVLALYASFTIKKHGTPRLFQMVWGLLALAAMILHLLEWRISSIFYYLILLSYSVLIVNIVRLNRREELYRAQQDETQ